MGCNQTKQADNQKANESRQVKTASTTGTSTTPVGMPGDEKTKAALQQQLSQSVNDKREAETDYFKKIIDRTVSDLIDVSTGVNVLESRDAKERVKSYSKQIRVAQKKPKDTQDPFALPLVSVTNNNALAANLLADTRLTEQENEFITKSCASFSRATQMSIQDCGPIVVSFG